MSVFLVLTSFLVSFLNSDTPPLSSAQLASKILFGMVVRERRRVASLARTASALDRKAVEALEQAASKDAALFSHIEEERHERATMAQNQQEHILSLMAMVREEEERNEAIFRNSSATNLGPASSSESMVMLLSNERIAVLERQLMEFQGEKNAKGVYKSKEAKARKDLEEKNRECNELQSEVQHLKLSLRQIRETLVNDSKIGMALGKKKSTLGFRERDSYDAMGQSDNKGIASLERDHIDVIIQEALHPSSKSPRKQASMRSRLSVEQRLNISSPPPRSSKIKDHVMLMHSSDSEDNGEAPEWAGDIMADLALIAEGEMPLSLRNSGKKKKRTPAARKKKSNLSSASVGSGKFRDGSMSETSSLSESVFERLTDPSHFTGVQKVSFLTAAEKLLNENKRPSSSQGRGTKGIPSVPVEKMQQTNSDRKVANDGAMNNTENHKPLQQNEILPSSEKPHSLSGLKIIVPAQVQQPVFKSPDMESQNTNSESPDIRSVFERLQSPSHMTFSYTQKNPLTTAKKKKRSVSEGNQLDGEDSLSLPLIPSKMDSPQAEAGFSKGGQIQQPSRQVSDNAGADDTLSENRSRESVSEYTQQDVFERLQKKVTASYAGKHQPEPEA